MTREIARAVIVTKFTREPCARESPGNACSSAAYIIQRIPQLRLNIPIAQLVRTRTRYDQEVMGRLQLVST
jgi:hypothetical protein